MFKWDYLNDLLTFCYKDKLITNNRYDDHLLKFQSQTILLEEHLKRIYNLIQFAQGLNHNSQVQSNILIGFKIGFTASLKYSVAFIFYKKSI